MMKFKKGQSVVVQPDGCAVQFEFVGTVQSYHGEFKPYVRVLDQDDNWYDVDEWQLTLADE